jgi:hypothetical protein
MLSVKVLHAVSRNYEAGHRNSMAHVRDSDQVTLHESKALTDETSQLPFINDPPWVRGFDVTVYR